MQKQPPIFWGLLCIILTGIAFEATRMHIGGYKSLGPIAVLFGALVAFVALFHGAAFKLSEQCLDESIKLLDEARKQMDELDKLSEDELVSRLVVAARLIAMARHMAKTSLVAEHRDVYKLYELNHRIEYNAKLKPLDEKLATYMLGQWRGELTQQDPAAREKAVSFLISISAWQYDESLKLIDSKLWSKVKRLCQLKPRHMPQVLAANQEIFKELKK